MDWAAVLDLGFSDSESKSDFWSSANEIMWFRHGTECRATLKQPVVP